MSQTPTISPPASTGGPPTASPRQTGWTTGRTVSLVIGSIVGLVALGVLAAAGFATWATNTRDNAGYVTSATHTVVTAGHAITSDRIELWTATDWMTPSDLVGTIRLRATATDPTTNVFIGVAPSDAVDRYLGGVNRQVITDWMPFGSHYRQTGSSAPPSAPSATNMWTTEVSGPGSQTLNWRPTGGQWTLVVMNADGRAPLAVRTNIGVTIPDLAWYAGILFVIGGLLLAVAAVLIAVPLARARR